MHHSAKCFCGLTMSHAFRFGGCQSWPGSCYGTASQYRPPLKAAGSIPSPTKEMCFVGSRCVFVNGSKIEPTRMMVVVVTSTHPTTCLGCPECHEIETTGPFIEVHWGVLAKFHRVDSRPLPRRPLRLLRKMAAYSRAIGAFWGSCGLGSPYRGMLLSTL